MAAVNSNEKKDLWVQWSKSAISRFVMPDEIDDAEELVNEMVAVAADFADAMLDEYEERFEAKAAKSRRKKADDDE